MFPVKYPSKPVYRPLCVKHGKFGQKLLTFSWKPGGLDARCQSIIWFDLFGVEQKKTENQPI